MLLSTFSWKNLYAGNNPWVRKDLDFAPPSQNSLEKSHNDLIDYARTHSISVYESAKELAFKEIYSHFGAFVERSFVRFFLLWSFDYFPIRHITAVIYPPISNSSFVLSIIVIFIMFHIIFLFFSIHGFLTMESNKKRILFLLLILAGIAPYVIAYSHTRYNLPQIALLIPIASIGILNMKQLKNKLKIFIMSLLLLIIIFNTYITYNKYNKKYILTSSYYKKPISAFNKFFNTSIQYIDLFKIKTNLPVVIKILNTEDFSFSKTKKIKRIKINERIREFKIYSERPKSRLQLKIYSDSQKRGITIEPISKEYWNKFKKIKGNDSYIKWIGGSY